jgi:hypothetical protein
MKTTLRLTTLAITAVAVAGFAGVLGAQQRGGGRAAPRTQAPRAQSFRAQAPRAQAPRAQSFRAQASRGGMESRAGQGVRQRTYAQARPEIRGRTDFNARSDVRGRNDYNNNARADIRGRNEFRGPDGRIVPVASHGRPLITRGAYGRAGFVGGRFGVRYGAGFNRFGGRLALPFGWENRVFVNGFFPASYASYCEAVPVDYDYMLPEMQPNYDSCLFGDRVIVMDRFSRGIVFAAELP